MTTIFTLQREASPLLHLHMLPDEGGNRMLDPPLLSENMHLSLHSLKLRKLEVIGFLSTLEHVPSEPWNQETHETVAPDITPQAYTPDPQHSWSPHLHTSALPTWQSGWQNPMFKKKISNIKRLSPPKMTNPILMATSETDLDEISDKEFRRTIICMFKYLKEDMNKCVNKVKEHVNNPPNHTRTRVTEYFLKRWIQHGNIIQQRDMNTK